MQTLPPALEKRLRDSLETTFLVEDLLLPSPEVPTLSDLAVLENDLSDLYIPRAVRRSLYFAHGSDPTSAVGVRLWLAVEGSAAALTILLAYLGTYQRRLPPNLVFTPDLNPPIGASGLSWSWPGQRTPGAICFIRANVLVVVSDATGVDAYRAAREIDDAIIDAQVIPLPGPNPYYPDAGASLAPALRVPLGGSRRLPSLSPPEGKTVLPRVSDGSLNHDPGSDVPWYFLAPPAEVDVVIDALTVGAGILPVGQRVPVHVR